jgi:branched-chain amino acid transport system ATP-binding protein
VTTTQLKTVAPEPDSRRAALEIRSVGLRYGGVVALNGVSFSVAAGETCGVIGPNGAGKTSLFDVVSGLRRPTSGSIVLDGRDATNRTAVWRARAGLRRTYQRAQVFGRLTVMENLLVATEWRGGGGGLLGDLVALPTRRRLEKRRRERAEAVIESCGLGELRDTYAGSLPIGLTRLLEFARAIVDEPKVLLLDEPASGIDEYEAARLAEGIRNLSAAHETAVVLVEHDMGFVMENCHRIVVLNLGTVLATGTPREIQANPAVLEAYLH